MAVTLDVKQFVKDYCSGVKDKDLLAKHRLSPKELVGVVKKLISEGLISKEEYFNRNKKIEELEARQEKDFLQSLYHCPVCSHIQPIPFQICPACGSNIDQRKSDSLDRIELDPFQRSSAALRNNLTDLHETDKAKMIPVSAPRKFLEKIGRNLTDIVFFDEAPSHETTNYVVVALESWGSNIAVFKAESREKDGRPLRIKLFDAEALGGSYNDFLNKVIAYQAGMDDVNILDLLGTANLNGHKVLIYPYLSKNLELLLQKNPEGLPLEQLLTLIPQILNAVGYSHMHRGKDGIVRRIPHINLKLEKFLINEEEDHIKLEDCAVWKSLVETRGYKRRLWEEPGIDLAALAPECFVLESKFLNAFSVDIYALGAALYRLSTGKKAFSGSDKDNYSFLHLKTFPIPPRVHRWSIPGWLDAMILRCFEKEPAKRWRSATQMELSIGKDSPQLF